MINQKNILTEGLLRYLKPNELQKIQSVKIGIGGAGGLGSNAAMMLVRTGFDKLEVLDFDIIEASNLNRQQYYADEVGLSKVEVLEKRLLAINPDLRITIHKTKWSPGIGNQFFKDCDFIVEAFDQVDFKHQFVNFYHDRAKYIVSGVGMAGLLEKQPMKIKKMGNIYFAGDITTCAHKGNPPMAPRVTMCAAMMAEIILDLTLGIPLHFSNNSRDT